MNLTPAELTRILNQPDYTLADGSLLDATRPPIDVAASKPGKASRWFSERHFQEEVIAQARLRAILQPGYGLLVAIPNGQVRAGQVVEPGLTAGMPDLVLLIPRGGHGALFLELKVGRNKPSRVQLDMIRRLRAEGYRCEIIWDSLEAVFEIIGDYLGEG